MKLRKILFPALLLTFMLFLSGCVLEEYNFNVRYALIDGQTVTVGIEMLDINREGAAQEEFDPVGIYIFFGTEEGDLIYGDDPSATLPNYAPDIADAYAEYAGRNRAVFYEITDTALQSFLDDPDEPTNGFVEISYTFPDGTDLSNLEMCAYIVGTDMGFMEYVFDFYHTEILDVPDFALPVCANGVQFTTNKLSIPCGDGTATLALPEKVSDPFTLTLTNAEITTTDPEVCSGYIGAAAIDLVNIVLEGDNFITLEAPDESEAYGLMFGREATISGDGTLTINVKHADGYGARQLVSEFPLTISDATLKLIGEDEEDCYGLSIYDITLDYGTLLIQSNAINSSDGPDFHFTSDAEDYTFLVSSAFDGTGKEAYVEESGFEGVKYLSIAPIMQSYKMLSGDGSECPDNAKTGLPFVSEAAFSLFRSVLVDGVKVDPENYTAESGSTKVTLNPGYLNTLSIGDHTMTIKSANGTATADFTVYEAPVTGDDNSLAISAIILVLASVAFGILLAKKRAEQA